MWRAGCKGNQRDCGIVVMLNHIELFAVGQLCAEHDSATGLVPLALKPYHNVFCEENII